MNFSRGFQPQSRISWGNNELLVEVATDRIRGRESLVPFRPGHVDFHSGMSHALKTFNQQKR